MQTVAVDDAKEEGYEEKRLIWKLCDENELLPLAVRFCRSKSRD